MRTNARMLFAIATLAIAALACQGLSVGGPKVILSDDFSSEQWGTGSDADSSVEYAGDALNFFITRDLYFVWRDRKSVV